MHKPGVAALVLAAWSFASCAVQAQDSIERGRYLVEGILTCGNCHSPRGPGGVVDSTRLYSGGPQTWDEPAFTVKGPNITPDPDTGIGRWSAADMKRAIQEGIRPNGSRIAPIMPTHFYTVFSPGDLDAVVAYLRSVPAVHNEVPPPIYKTALPSEVFPGADKPPSESDLRDPVERGRYLATVGHCMECHTPGAIGHHDFTGGLGQGGQKFLGPWGNRFPATSPRTRRRESAPGAMPRSSAPSPKAFARTAAGSSRRWGLPGMRA